MKRWDLFLVLQKIIEGDGVVKEVLDRLPKHKKELTTLDVQRAFLKVNRSTLVASFRYYNLEKRIIWLFEELRCPDSQTFIQSLKQCGGI